MGRTPPSDEVIARAWEMQVEGRSLRYIGEKLGISPETARKYAKQGRIAEAWIRDDDEDPSYNRAVFAAFLDMLIADGKDRYTIGGGDYETVAPVMLRAAAEKAKMLGLYATTKYDIKMSGDPPPSPELQEEIRKVIERRDNGAAPGS